MATGLEFGENIRNSDLYDEPVHRLLVPIRGYEDQPILPLTQTIQPISGLFKDIQDYVYVALHNCQHPLDGLDQQEAASIHLYTIQFHGQPSLYHLLNQTLRAENREELKPWFPFLKLFLTALYKLPSQSGIVWRGVKNVDLSSKYKRGTRFVWWGVSSCTTDIQVLESNTFLGKHGDRTIFSIECRNGKSISNQSYFKNKEKELILLPGSYFEVIGQLNPSPQLHIIQLIEIQPPITFISSPFSSSLTHQTTTVNQNTTTFTQTTTTNSIPTVTLKIKPLQPNKKWKKNGIIVASGTGKENPLNQLSYPHGIFTDDYQTIYIADWGNDRIVEYKPNSQKYRIAAGGNRRGKQTNQLNCPTDVLIDKQNNCLIIADRGNKRVIEWSLKKNTTYGKILIENIDCWGLAMDKDGSLYVSDCDKNEVRRWKRGEKEGTTVAGGNGEGNQFSFLTHIFVDEDYSLYMPDYNNHCVMKWLKDAKKGMIVAGKNCAGNGLKLLSHPQGVIVDEFGQIYVSDCWNDRVMCWSEGDDEGRIVVGGNGQGNQLNQLSYPRGLSFDIEGNLYVADCENNRILKFEVDLN